MPSWRRITAETLPVPGARGGWRRRVAEGATEINGAALGALGLKGSWDRRLAEAAGLTAGPGCWSRRLNAGVTATPGSWDRPLYDGEALIPAQDHLVTEVGDNIVTETGADLLEE